MKLVLSLVFLCFAVWWTPGKTTTLDQKEYSKLKAAGLFYNKPTGSVAFLPKVGDERYLDKVRTHYLLPESGFYRLRKKGNYFFRINNRADSEEVSYVGIIAYIVYPENFRHRNPLNLTRNKANWQSGDEGRVLDKARRGPKSPDISLNDFFQAHGEDINSCKDADHILSFTWHAAVETESAYSWTYRSRWQNARPPMLDEFLNELSLSKETYSAAITAHLLHFTMSRNPKKPLDFWFNADHAVGAYVRIFSPIGPLFEKEFYFSFE